MTGLSCHQTCDPIRTPATEIKFQHTPISCALHTFLFFWLSCWFDNLFVAFTPIPKVIVKATRQFLVRPTKRPVLVKKTNRKPLASVNLVNTPFTKEGLTTTLTPSPPLPPHRGEKDKFCLFALACNRSMTTVYPNLTNNRQKSKIWHRGIEWGETPNPKRHGLKPAPPYKSSRFAASRTKAGRFSIVSLANKTIFLLLSHPFRKLLWKQQDNPNITHPQSANKIKQSPRTPTINRSH
jgi:hypothetical protein